MKFKEGDLVLYHGYSFLVDLVWEREGIAAIYLCDFLYFPCEPQNGLISFAELEKHQRPTYLPKSEWAAHRRDQKDYRTRRDRYR